MTQVVSLSKYEGRSHDVKVCGVTSRRSRSEIHQYEKVVQEKSRPVRFISQATGSVFRLRRRRGLSVGSQMWCFPTEESARARRCEEARSVPAPSIHAKTPYSPVGAEERRWRYPKTFRDQYQRLSQLQDGWGGEDEIAPRRETLLKVLRLAEIIASCSSDLAGISLFPALFPGFLGQVELKYRHGNRAFHVEVSGDPQSPMAFLKTSRAQKAGAHEHAAGFLESAEAVRPLLEWLLSE